MGEEVVKWAGDRVGRIMNDDQLVVKFIFYEFSNMAWEYCENFISFGDVH